MERTASTDAFSAQAPVFDTIDADHPIIAWMRAIARTEALRHMRRGDHLLELNAGTGLDAFHFAAHGIHVTATDGAPGMIAAMQAKQRKQPALPITIAPCTFDQLQQLPDAAFDHVFSNFGGLNCSAHLITVLRQVDRVLRPGGTSTLVIMPRFSPWELAACLRGNFRVGLRRWRSGGAPAMVEDTPFPCYYYSVHDVQRGLGDHHRQLSLRALSFFVPPPHSLRHYQRWPRMMRILHHLEASLADRWPFNSAGDHFLITMKKG
jgi:ubiquinone/menaquinone biosynthesis C-methylase UbiE